jgi:hypothetical protein
MTNAEEASQAQSSVGENIAQSIRDVLKDHPHAEVRVNPVIQAIPPHIAANLMEFLRRVQSTGMEAVAWVEAYQFVQKYAPQPEPAAAPLDDTPPK